MRFVHVQTHHVGRDMFEAVRCFCPDKLIDQTLKILLNFIAIQVDQKKICKLITVKYF